MKRKRYKFDPNKIRKPRKLKVKIPHSAYLKNKYKIEAQRMIYSLKVRTGLTFILQGEYGNITCVDGNTFAADVYNRRIVNKLIERMNDCIEIDKLPKKFTDLENWRDYKKK